MTDRSHTYDSPPEDWADVARRPVHVGPSNKADLPGFLSTKVVGMSFHDEYPALIHRMRTEGYAGLVLVREPDNAYDPNAVAVALIDATEGPIGHLPAALAARIAPEIDAGTVWDIVTSEVLVAPGHEHNPGLSVTLARKDGPARKHDLVTFPDGSRGPTNG